MDGCAHPSSARQPRACEAEILAVGTELLLGQIHDTNARFLAQRLAELGINLHRITFVGDNLQRLEQAIREASGRADLLLLTGGLGSTQDDLTRQALAEAWGGELILEPSLLTEIEAYFARRGKPMPPSNRIQACLPKGARPIPNVVGTAPGIFWEKGGQVAVAMPGVPREMEAMFRTLVQPWLRQWLHTAGFVGGSLVSRVLRFVGISESALAEAVAEEISQSQPTVAPLLGPGEVFLRLTARLPAPPQAGPGAAESPAAAARQDTGVMRDVGELLDATEQSIRRKVGEYCFGRDEQSLAEVVGTLLRQRGLRLCTAESCTGGLLGHLITQVPGSSDYYVGGWVTYSNEAKQAYLGVPAEILAQYGAVSAACALAMARGARQHSQPPAQVAVSITGVAGPGGGSPQKPVGLVYAGLSAPGTEVALEWHLQGSREDIQLRSAKWALEMIRRWALGLPIPDRQGWLGRRAAV